MNTKTSVPTDSQKKITVESQLLYALWTQGRAYAGFEAEFEVKTLLVGDGATVKATCFTEKGKKLGKVEGAMVLNRFKGKVLIPESVKPDDYVYLQVEVAKIGLKGESNSIPVRPPLQAKSLKWSKKEVERDEEVTMTCEFTNGVEEGDDVQVIVYEHDNDGNHDKVVVIPATVKNNKVELQWKFDYQDPVAQIPTEDEMNVRNKHYENPQFFFMVIVDGIRIGEKRESGLLKFKDWVEVKICDSENNPCSDLKGSLTLADGSKKDFTTDDDGKFKLDTAIPGRIMVIIKDIKNVGAIQNKAGEEVFIELSPQGVAAVITTGESYIVRLCAYNFSS